MSEESCCSSVYQNHPTNHRNTISLVVYQLLVTFGYKEWIFVTRHLVPDCGCGFTKEIVLSAILASTFIGTYYRHISGSTTYSQRAGPG